jgi:hypothetical protein
MTKGSADFLDRSDTTRFSIAVLDFQERERLTACRLGYIVPDRERAASMRVHPYWERRKR